MKKIEIQGTRRGRKCWTTVADGFALPANRQFTTQPGQINCGWQTLHLLQHERGLFMWLLYPIFLPDTLLTGGSRPLHTDLVLDALEQALWLRKETAGLIHHSDHGSQYLPIRYTERLKQSNIAASVGSTGDSYDNAMAETINGLQNRGHTAPKPLAQYRRGGVCGLGMGRLV